MGRIRPTSVKRATEKILKQYPKVFTSSFKENKEKLKGYAEIRSKKIFNLLAGSLTRAIVMSKKEHKPRVMRDEFKLPDSTKPKIPRFSRNKIDRR